MKCPNCGLFNPESAVRCDCGYDFGSKTIEASYIDGIKHDKSFKPIRLVKRLLFLLIAILVSGVFIALWKMVVPPNYITGAIMGLIAGGIGVGAWKWSARFK